MKKQSIFLLAVGMLFTLIFQVSTVKAVNFTLSDEALMSLDWYPSYYETELISKTDVPGKGVEFDIFFPGNDSSETSFYYKSTNEGGAGTLSETDVSMFDDYELEFSLVSVNGTEDVYIRNEIVVGSQIGHPGRYDPEWLNSRRSATSSTPLGRLGDNPEYDLNLESIDFLGFCVHLYGDNWSSTGNNVTVLVEPAPGAVEIVPEPASIFLLGLGGTILLRRRKN